MFDSSVGSFELMRVLAMSDLHFENHRDEGASFIQSLESELVDVIVLAGDICSFHQLRATLTKFCDRFDQVVFVFGNHELYESSFDRVRNRLAKLSHLTNLHVLNNQVTTIAGQRFVGTTLWFRDRPDNAHFVERMSDFTRISDFAECVYEENRAAIRFLEDELRAGDLVVTHHLPSRLCMLPRWQGSPLNRFFVCELDSLIVERQPRLWIHGHAPESSDVRIGKTRVLRNPFGYVGYALNSGFDDSLCVELD